MKFYNPINFFKYIKYYGSGLVLLRNSKYLDAISALQKSLQYAPKNKLVIYNLNKYIGIAYCLDKQFQKAKECLLEAEKIRIVELKNGMDSELFCFLGIVYDTEENLKKAKEYYQLSIKNYKKIDELTKIDFISDRLIKIDKSESGTL
jgi:tetratricopeptide (TPR) repeat protein